MNPIELADFARTVGGTLTAPPANAPAAIRGFATDSNAVEPGDLFLAIRGERVDGHAFVSGALQKGAVASLVERPVDGPHIQVENVVAALARFAAARRETFRGPVVGITGSAGKTTTKEFVAAALSPLGPVLKTEGNRNTEFTSPLLWADLTPDTRAVVVEMAMRGFGQIAHLAAFTRAKIGVVTNVGYSHLLQVGSREGIARAKGELLESLPASGTAILWQGDDFLSFLTGRAEGRTVRTFGFSAEADCVITGYRPLDWSRAVVEGTLDGRSWTAELPAVGRHTALNAAAAVLTASSAGVAPERAAAELAKAKLPPMRMEIRHLQGATLLMDNYNASPPSMLSAIETLAELPVAHRRLAVIGEMRELGEHTAEAHRSIGRALAEAAVDGVVFVGDPMRDAHDEFLKAGGDAANASLADSLNDVAEFLRRAERGDAILVKGSRALELERALDGMPVEGA